MAALSQARAQQAERAAAKTENITTNKPGEGKMTYSHDPELELPQLLILFAIMMQMMQ